MNKISNSFTSIEQVASQYLNQPQKNTNLQIEKNGLSFEEILKQKQYLKQNEATTLKFSKHAVNRLEEREISLSNEQVDRLNEGARKASEKGIKESLVMVDSLAFIVHVPSKTVVTAMDSTTSNDNIFTNIDGAVIM